MYRVACHYRLHGISLVQTVTQIPFPSIPIKAVCRILSRKTNNFTFSERCPYKHLQHHVIFDRYFSHLKKLRLRSNHVVMELPICTEVLENKRQKQELQKFNQIHHGFEIIAHGADHMSMWSSHNHLSLKFKQ